MVLLLLAARVHEEEAVEFSCQAIHCWMARRSLSIHPTRVLSPLFNLFAQLPILLRAFVPPVAWSTGAVRDFGPGFTGATNAKRPDTSGATGASGLVSRSSLLVQPCVLVPLALVSGQSRPFVTLHECSWSTSAPAPPCPKRRSRSCRHAGCTRCRPCQFPQALHQRQG